MGSGSNSSIGCFGTLQCCKGVTSTQLFTCSKSCFLQWGTYRTKGMVSLLTISDCSNNPLVCLNYLRDTSTKAAFVPFHSPNILWLAYRFHFKRWIILIASFLHPVQVWSLLVFIVENYLPHKCWAMELRLQKCTFTKGWVMLHLSFLHNLCVPILWSFSDSV